MLTKDLGLSLSSRPNDREGEYPDSDAEFFMLFSNSSSDASSVSDDESVCSRDVGQPRPRLVEDRIGHSQWRGQGLDPTGVAYSFQTFGSGGYENVEREEVLRRGRRVRVHRG